MKFRVAKQGFDVNMAKVGELAIDERLMTMKVALSGTLEIDLPAETIVAGGGIVNKDYTDTVTHGLNRVPLFFPMVGRMYLDPDSASDIVLNDYRRSTTNTLELALVQVTDEQLRLFVSRTAIITNKTFTAHKVTLYYTLFYNCLEELDLSIS